MEQLKKQLGSTGFDLQAELDKLEKAQLKEDEMNDGELDPRYRGLPELFEKRIFQKHREQIEAQHKSTLAAASTRKTPR